MCLLYEVGDVVALHLQKFFRLDCTSHLVNHVQRSQWSWNVWGSCLYSTKRGYLKKKEKKNTKKKAFMSARYASALLFSFLEMIMLIIICQQNLVWRERQNYVLSKKNLAEHKCIGLADLLDTETQSSNFCHFEVIDPFGTILFSSWPKIRFESGSLCSPTAIITEGFGFFLGAFCCCCKSTTSMLCYCKSLPACCVTVNLYQHAVLL